MLGFSRQYYYKHCKALEVKRCKEREVLNLVHSRRRILPRLGTRKIYHQIKPAMHSMGLKLGRDNLFTLLRTNELLIKPTKRYVSTTNSKHWLRKYPNMVKDIHITAPEQVWVSDITYIKTDEGNCYLNMVTDAFSRRIMGFSIADTMNTEEMKKAYEMALAQRTYPQHQLIHHSDRGLQYCSAEYVLLSTENKHLISMTENGDPYENALAERMNRTLKEEFGLGRRLPSKQQAFRLTQEAIQLYNEHRPHLALKMETPNTVHLQKNRPPEAVGSN
jgi:putative transposase